MSSAVLDQDIKEQLSQYLQMLEGDLLIKVSAGDDQASGDMMSFLKEIASLSPRITIEKTKLPRTPSFTIQPAGAAGQDGRITFAGIPLGHEFTSLVLALLQVSGRAPKAEPDILDQIKAIKGEYRFETYVSLSCHICPDIVQACPQSFGGRIKPLTIVLDVEGDQIGATHQLHIYSSCVGML